MIKKKFLEWFSGMIEQLRRQPWKVAAVVIVFGLLNWFAGFVAAFFWSLFLLFALFGWDGRLFFCWALVFLIACPLYLLQRKEGMAENVAIYAYYFMCLGLFLDLIDYVRTKNKNPKND
jgi:hypothetical protein